MSTDLEKLLRRRKPHKKLTQLSSRPPDDLVAASSLPLNRSSILPDTNVYIYNQAGRLPSEVSKLLDNSILFHCSVCLAEVTTGLGNYDPRSPNWDAVIEKYNHVFATIPTSRILKPSADIWLDAGMIAGIVSRTQNYQAEKRKEFLNDALIYLTAAKNGIPVLTSNRVDFDLLQQLVPNGQFAYYVPISK